MWKRLFGSTPKAYAFCDLLVIGAGPAGLAAAAEAAGGGLSVLVVDESPRAGGSLLWQRARDEAARELLDQLLKRVESQPGVELALSTQAQPALLRRRRGRA